MEHVRSFPNGFLLMDTNCLLNYIEGKESVLFDYQRVEDFIRRNGWALIITPYTLWESIQGCTDINFIRRRRDELLSNKIWVLNVDEILDNTYSFVSVKNVLNQIGFNPMTLREYADTRSGFRSKVYEILYPKIITIIQLIAFIYLTITERNADGTYPERFDYRLGAVLNYFRNHSNLKYYLTMFLQQAEGLSYFKDGTLQKPLDAKDHLKDEIDEIVKIIIATSKVLEEHRSGVKPYANDGEYYSRINEECKRIKREKLYERGDMVRRYKTFLKVAPERTTDAIIEEIFEKGPEVILQMYKKLIADWFTPNGTGKQMLNTIIDYSNIDFIFTSGMNNWVYMTEEDQIIKTIFSTNDVECNATRDFYKKFYSSSKY